MEAINDSNWIANATHPFANDEQNVINRIIDSLYIFLGGVSFVANGTIIVVILLCANLRNRKELFLLVGLAFADQIFGLSCVGAGIRSLFVKELYQEFVSNGVCLKRFELVLGAFALQAEPLMTFCISIDRLLAIRWFKFYNEFAPGKYFLLTIGLVYTLTMFSCVTAFALLASDANYCTYSKMSIRRTNHLLCTNFVDPTAAFRLAIKRQT